MNGISVEGIADLVVETKEEIVIIDHKSFPGSTSQSKERAMTYAPQLSAYKRVVEMSSKRPIIETRMHIPLMGIYVHILN